MEIKDPTAPATERQLELVRHLAAQFYAPAQVERVVKMSATRGQAAEIIDKLLDAGGTKPARQAPARKPNRGNKASDKQVSYALALLRRGGWYDSDMGQDGSPAPTEAELRRMTRSEISALIDDLR